MAAPAPGAGGAEFYGYLRTLISLVVGLAIAQILGGLAKIVQHPDRQKLSGVHLAWAASILLAVVHLWWSEFRLSGVSWTFALYLFVIAFASLYYFLAALLFPTDMAEYAGFEDFFLSRRRWFFGLLAVSYAADLADTLVKGRVYFHELGWEYLARAGGYVALCGVAMATRNRTFHRLFAAANLIYQASWIFRLYNIAR